MSTTILVTKLFIPPTRSELVRRTGLIKRLNRGLDRKLTLISAPAGFGKTTLVSEWLEKLSVAAEKGNQNLYKIAWLSLDEGDNDPIRFLTYFIAALNRLEGIEKDLGQGALSLLQEPQPLQIDSILTYLINDIAAVPGNIIFVLDDLHLIEAQPIHDTIAYLLDHLPPQLHLVIATREDPHLNIPRLQARNQVNELRASDLRFSSAEASEFLNQVMGLNLSTKDITALETRTEGWIAGLQLAAISMRGREDAASLIKAFTGSHRLVLDFLIEEVLGQQPENIQNFLLKTAILDQLTGSLCNALTHESEGQATLESLERANLFIIPQDDERYCYRYHHLFADSLRHRLKQTQPEQITLLNQKASKWYELNGFAEQAIEHALRAKDFERASNLIEKEVENVWARGRDTILRRWLEGIPVEFVFSKPHLCIFRAWDLFASGQQGEAEKFLHAAERIQDPINENKPKNQDQPPNSSARIVRGRAAAIRAWMAAYRTDIPAIIEHASQALEYLPEQDINWRSAAAVTLGDAHFLKGDYYSAHQARKDAMEASETAGNIYLFLNVSVKQALTLKALGHLRGVIEICQQGMQLANEKGISQTAVVGWLLSIWGEALAEMNHLDEALDRVEKGIKLTGHGRDVVMLGWSYLSLIRVLFSRGELDGAEKIVQKMKVVSRESTLPIWILNTNAGWQTRIWLTQDRLDAASNWVRERGLEPDDQPTYVGGIEYIAFARILVAQGRCEESIRLLQSLLEPAEVGGNITRVIEILILQALAFQASGIIDQALDLLTKTMRIAEPESFIRIFVDEGPPMAGLLYEALRRKIAPDYVKRLLQAFPIHEPEQSGLPDTKSLDAGYIEPLSNRETEVLQLIAEGLTNPMIASRLFLSLYTVKVHTRNIYGKLDAHNRVEAITKARAMGILPPN